MERSKTLNVAFLISEKNEVGFNSIKSLDFLLDELNSAFSTSKYFVLSVTSTAAEIEYKNSWIWHSLQEVKAHFFKK